LIYLLRKERRPQGRRNRTNKKNKGTMWIDRVTPQKDRVTVMTTTELALELFH
jgi:hypothetical protein